MLCSWCWVQTPVAEQLCWRHCCGGGSGLGAEAGDAAGRPWLWSILCSGGLSPYRVPGACCPRSEHQLHWCWHSVLWLAVLGTPWAHSSAAWGAARQRQPAGCTESCRILPVAKGLLLDMEQHWFTQQLSLCLLIGGNYCKILDL